MVEKTDLSQLNAGFEALVCASKIRVVLDQAITDGDAAAIAKLSSAVSSQAGLARRLLEPFGSDPVSRAYIAKNAPKPKDDDDWEY